MKHPPALSGWPTNFLFNVEPTTPQKAAFAEAEIPRVLFQQGRIGIVAPKARIHFIRQSCSEAFSVTLRALAVRGKLVVGLAERGLNSNYSDRDRIERHFWEQAKFFAGPKWWRFLAIRHAKLRPYASTRRD